MKIGCIVVLLCSAYMSVASASSFYHDDPKGWYWYDDRESQKPKTSPKPTAKEVIAQQKARYDEALAAAVVNPTPDNIKAYFTISKIINEQASTFSKRFKTSLWQNPQFDRAVTHKPSSGQAIVTFNQEKQDTKNETLSHIATRKGILYFFRSDCQYCHQFAPILQKFAKTYQFTVIPVTLDGQGSANFPNPKTSHHLASKLNVSAVPATFLVDPRSNQVTTIGYGFSDWTEFGDKVVFSDAQTEQLQP